ncbi:MAG: type IV pilin protein [Thioalkalispiraceae bacterium]|jgi:type IV pilus assembly protein PilE
MKSGNKQQKGLTLIELITTVAIIAILVGLAVPAYDRYTRNTTRAAAKTSLEQVRALVERYYLNNKVYTNDLTNLGYNNNPIEVDKTGEEVPAGSASSMYQIVINSPGVFCAACTYEVGAIPLNGQTNDTDCMTIFINSRNQKGASGPKGIKCW